jgi:hypothetical protein
MVAKCNLYQTPGGFLYFSPTEQSIDDLYICAPQAFYLRRGEKMIALKKAADSDYFVLGDSL